jgi:alkyl hydroperoxide reductase subunit D
MSALETLRDLLPDAARDLKINLQNVLGETVLNEAQRYGIAVACALTARHPKLASALEEEAREKGVGDGTLEDARAAAYLMGMNNVFYSFRKLVEKDSYAAKPARLRMQRIAKVAASKLDFELFCLAASAIGKCAPCVNSHEDAVIKGGLTEDHVHDAVRIAATINGVAISLIAVGH